jgi:hypothetical protein
VVDRTYRLQLLSLLANAGVRDDRILVQLVQSLSESPPEAAMYLAEYGDPVALPELSRALDAHKLSLPDDPSDDHAVFELREAIQLLGGKLTAAQQRKYECARLARRIAVSEKSDAASCVACIREPPGEWLERSPACHNRPTPTAIECSEILVELVLKGNARARICAA